MIVWGDRTFCAARCLNTACPRHLSVTKKNHTKLPISMADMSTGCKSFVPNERASNDPTMDQNRPA